MNTVIIREDDLIETIADALQYISYFHPMDYIRSEEHTSELKSLMRISYAVFCLKKKNTTLHEINLPFPINERILQYQLLYIYITIDDYNTHQSIYKIRTIT